MFVSSIIRSGPVYPFLVLVFLFLFHDFPCSLGNLEKTWEEADGLRYKWTYSDKLRDHVKTVVHDSSTRRGDDVWTDKSDGLKHQWTFSPVSKKWIDTALGSHTGKSWIEDGVEYQWAWSPQKQTYIEQRTSKKPESSGSNSPVRSPLASSSPIRKHIILDESPAHYAVKISSNPPWRVDLCDLDSHGLPQFTYTKNYIRGDGNCLYRALSYLVKRNQDSHWNIRERVFKEIQESGEYIDSIQDGTMTFDDFVSKDSANGAWGGEHTLAAAARVLNKKIIMLSLASTRPYFRAYGSAPVDPEDPGLVFLGDHYELLFSKPR
ncbi:hypothetical protein PGT21_008417 [Puccinia graminis f. sp. tritici]|uniref:OTU domain-containing protein n=1 Tax=Puccinia graminis f. sp. tritici TaxID=56615 RepID=A0A5B0RD37_PUCGR|nr:hypothetical protein PGT21_008417 [Puccinia graminis f. sp. tritici]KAA1122973.1 hypothetical protein PGTUg99_011617 [Puccinia graminis f. sp. tritici]